MKICMKVFTNLKTSKNKVRNANDNGKDKITANEVGDDAQNWAKTLNLVFFLPEYTTFVVPKRSFGVSESKPLRENNFSASCELSKCISLLAN